MSDIDKLKDIIRATRTAPEFASDALEKIRVILGTGTPKPPAADPVPEKPTRDRKSKGGFVRGDTSGKAGE